VNIVALIPARAGSKRCVGKNTRLLGGTPLLAWTIAAAQESGVFSAIYCCTDDDTAWNIARAMGIQTMVRPPVPDDQPDIFWVRDALPRCQSEAFAILRPTSPFRTAATIQRAFTQFKRSEVHSIRAVQPVKESPFKMWTWEGAGYPMKPFMASDLGVTPWHSRPTQTLPQVYVQNSSLEMAWTYVVSSFNTISGTKIAPFFTEGHEGFAVDTEQDWSEAERLVAVGAVSPPAATVPQPL